jgi:CRISPR-associated endonuclease Cas3-HD
VAKVAKQFAMPLGLVAEAELVALLHDLGKYAERFQARLRNPRIHGINHWAAGARKAADLKAPLVDYAVDGHHTGLPTFGDLRQSLLKMGDGSASRELTGCDESVSELIRCFEGDGLRVPSAPARRQEPPFAAALRTRMLFSCLVDADFLDTEQHFNSEASRQRAVPPLQAEVALRILLEHLHSKPADGPVNQLRRRLLTDCLSAAQQPPGLFTLTAPTGSGKTLASLAFALQHAVHHNANLPTDDPPRFRRVIIVIPYTSIIEQTAGVYRGLFEGVFGPDYVLEHHCAVAPRERKEDKERDAEEERLRRARLAAENWASPLVVTTSVQYFESLFAHKPSDCRKLHNIGRSVVLFDEVQTLPLRLVPSLLSAVNLLVQDYGLTAVFGTAT